jgi:signal transduction histidine kinase/CheY-like chemotaxis protein
MTDPNSETAASTASAASETLPLEHARSFPEIAPAPTALSAETTSLESLVHHKWSVADDTPLETVHQFFQGRDIEFIALVRDGRVSGLCSRARLGFMLGSRYGFALYSRSPAHLAQVAHPLIFDRATPIHRILDSALARNGDEFHEDVVLVSEVHRLLGLIPVEALAHLQSRLVNEQLGELRRQHALLRDQNLELFETNHELRQTRGLYQSLFESNALGVALLDLRGLVQVHNRRLADLLNLRTVSSESFFLADRVLERDRPQFHQLLQTYHDRDPAPVTHEFTLQIEGRGSRLFRFNTGWINETSQICACLEDITNRRTMERHLRHKEKQLLLDTLVGGIAHELNNKLTPVMGFAELLKPGFDERSRLYVKYIIKSVEEAAHIIRQLLQLSKPDSARPQIVDLRQCVEESLVMLRFQIRQASVQVQTTLPPAPVNVLADPAQLKQVLMNLVINSLQAMATVKEPVLNIGVGQRESSVWMTVRDNGTGISTAILGRIFDPFFTTKGPDKGSGLGLSICSSIVRKYGGDIAVESEPDNGACFTVSLPAAGDCGPLAKEALVSPLRENELANRRVLIVEDEDVIRNLLQEVVRSHFGCSVDATADGNEGLALATRGGYDLIISDIRMPGISGLELYLRLRELQPVMAKRFLLVSGHAGDKQIDEEIRRWNIPLVTKPFTMTSLAGACIPFLRAAGAARLAV